MAVRNMYAKSIRYRNQEDWHETCIYLANDAETLPGSRHIDTGSNMEQIDQ